jgi:hypothetical protein
MLQYIEKCFSQQRNVRFSYEIQIKKSPDSYRGTLRGFDQIRTGVEGFADLCLATRPRNPD